MIRADHVILHGIVVLAPSHLGTGIAKVHPVALGISTSAEQGVTQRIDIAEHDRDSLDP